MTETNFLSLPVGELPGIGPKRKEQIERLGAKTVEDLLYLFPRRYIDRRNVSKISELAAGQPAVVYATVDEIERRYTSRRGLELVVASASDESGEMTLSWFNRKGMEYVLKEGTTAVFYGTPSFDFHGISMLNPDFEVSKPGQQSSFTGIIPVYPSTAELQPRWFAHLMETVVRQYAPCAAEFIPTEILKKEKMPEIGEALLAMHRPRSGEEWRSAHRRIAFEELFVVCAALSARRAKLKSLAPAAKIAPGKIYSSLLENLPFGLTNSQTKALSEIFADTASSSPMTRLLQGDVGAGKTAVALGLTAAAADSNVQTAIMAPTEILASQLYEQARGLLCPLGVKTVFLKGGLKAAERREIISSISDGSAAVVVGTQALIQSGVEFRKLGAVIIDEQHRFGVEQRASLVSRGSAPHILMMTATPIPRTLTLCVYGDLDISLLTDKPAGRKKTETRVIGEDKMRLLLQFIVDKAMLGEKTFWVCPRVEEDGASALVSAKKRYEFLEKHLGKLGVALVHGRMDAEEKEKAVSDFRNGDAKILIGTTVVEVGIDVPDASVIVIESPERFGLSQLHQLRGRVGRGGSRGVCVLLMKSLADGIPPRLEIMLNSDDGFKIAEQDLLLRGSGEVSGVSQHGMTEFKVAELPRDIKLLEKARNYAALVIRLDPKLDKNFPLKAKIDRLGNASPPDMGVEI